MANFTAGTSFSDGVTNDVTAAKLNALVADAVPTSSLALASTTGTISNFTASTANITLGTIPTLTAGTTTSTAANITSGTIGNLSTTLAGDFTISQGTGTLGTTGATAATYGTTSDVPRITVDAKGRITAASTVTNPVGFRNRIINGDMRIDQRNAGASVTVSAGSYFYTLDRFFVENSTDGALTTQRSTIAPSGYSNSIKITTSTVDASLASGQLAYILQKIEGFNISDLGWGTASAKTVTLSFWVRSSLTGTFGGSFRNGFQGSAWRSNPFSYSISLADTWEQKTITVVGDTSGTWGTDNGVGIEIFFGIGAGSLYNGTAGVWSSNNYTSVTGAVSVIGTLNATFYITGVQLEAGSTATDFERRPYGTELALCQRYYWKTSSGNAYARQANGFIESATKAEFMMRHPVQMRSTPTVVNSSGSFLAFHSGGNSVLTVNSLVGLTDQVSDLYFDGTGMTASAGAILISNNNSNAYIGFSAEL